MNAKVFELHPVNPQARLVGQIADLLRQGGIMAYPTDSGYALGCALANGAGLERIRDIRKLDEKHDFTMVCREFAQIGQLALVSNANYRLIKSLTPGPYTFILKGTKEVPRDVEQEKTHLGGADSRPRGGAESGGSDGGANLVFHLADARRGRTAVGIRRRGSESRPPGGCDY